MSAVPRRPFLGLLLRLLRRVFTLPRVAGILSGLIFLGVFAQRYGEYDPHAYEYRDDGVITLSHARNWVDHGHIGVDPSGSRVEGYSSPLQFFIYSALYALTGNGWHSFMADQTLVCTFLLGFFFVQFFRKNLLIGLLLSYGAAWFLSLNYVFMGWHGSGMENPWHHVTVLVLVLGAWEMLRKGNLHWGWAVAFWLATLARLESIYHVLPVLVLWSAFWRIEHRNWRAVGLSGVVVAAWGLVFLWRWWYFGDIMSNSGKAQGISVVANLDRLVEASEPWVRWWSRSATANFGFHGMFFAIALVPLLPFARQNRRLQWMLLAGASLLATAYFHPLIFGHARLDWSRTTTFAPLIVAMLLATTLFSLQWKRNFWVLIPLVIGLIVFFRLVSIPFIDQRRDLCCPIDKWTEIEEYADRFAAENDLHRLNVATPDLGKISYPKKYNITDMGLLGSPLMGELYPNPDFLTTYLLQYQLPDFIEFHHYWIHTYGRVWTEKWFEEEYEMVLQKEDRDDIKENYPELKMGMFVRKALKKGSQHPERQLILDLKAGVSVERIQQELEVAIEPMDPRQHQYVVRSAYRFLPEFRAAGLEAELVAAFAETPSAPYDQAILNSANDRKWVDKALAWLKPQLRKHQTIRMAEAISQPCVRILDHYRFRAYLTDDNRLFYSVLKPTAADQDLFLMAHFHPLDPADGDQYGFLYGDFKLDSTAVYVDNEAFQGIRMPDVPLDAVILGVRRGDQRLWEEKVTWPFSLMR